jgi:hypothetical protein
MNLSTFSADQKKEKEERDGLASPGRRQEANGADGASRVGVAPAGGRYCPSRTRRGGGGHSTVEGRGWRCPW